jgi:hypothetical protein
MSNVIVPRDDAMEYVATGEVEIFFGAASLHAAAQRSSEVHVKMGAGRVSCGGGWLRTTGAGGDIGALSAATGATLRGKTGAWLVPGVNDHSCGGGSLGSVAQPAKNISATPKMMTENLNTRPF